MFDLLFCDLLELMTNKQTIDQISETLVKKVKFKKEVVSLIDLIWK